MINNRYTVWETNAELEEVRNYYIGDSKDIAETLACKLYVAAEYKKDFIITVRKGADYEIAAYLFSERTKQLRNECHD